jgi:hypothetical protein
MENHNPGLKTFQAHRSFVARQPSHPPANRAPPSTAPSSLNPTNSPTRIEVSEQSLTMMGRVHRFLTDGEKSRCKMEQTSICWREAGERASKQRRGGSRGKGAGWRMTEFRGVFEWRTVGVVAGLRGWRQCGILRAGHRGAREWECMHAYSVVINRKTASYLGVRATCCQVWVCLDACCSS